MGQHHLTAQICMLLIWINNGSTSQKYMGVEVRTSIKQHVTPFTKKQTREGHMRERERERGGGGGGGGGGKRERERERGGYLCALYLN